MNKAEMTNEALCALASAGDRSALDELLQKNENAVIDRAMTAWNGFAKSRADLALTADDFLQTARLALWEAAEKFDDSGGTRFLTFAWTVINRRLADLVKPGFADLEKTGEMLSLTDRADGDDGLMQIETIPAPTSAEPDVAFWQNYERQCLWEALGALPDRERIYLLHRFGFLDEDPKTKKAASSRFYLTGTRLEKLERSALDHVRTEFETRFRRTVEYVLACQQRLREDEGLNIPFVPTSVCANLPFSPVCIDNEP